MIRSADPFEGLPDVKPIETQHFANIGVRREGLRFEAKSCPPRDLFRVRSPFQPQAFSRRILGSGARDHAQGIYFNPAFTTAVTLDLALAIGAEQLQSLAFDSTGREMRLEMWLIALGLLLWSISEAKSWRALGESLVLFGDWYFDVNYGSGCLLLYRLAELVFLVYAYFPLILRIIRHVWRPKSNPMALSVKPPRVCYRD